MKLLMSVITDEKILSIILLVFNDFLVVVVMRKDGLIITTIIVIIHQILTNPSQNDEKQERGKNIHNGDTKKVENACYRCGMKGCWSRTYFMTKHLFDLYQSPLKGNENNIKIKFSHPHQENMDSHHAVNKPNISGKDICLANSATTHIIFRHKQYFSNMRMMKEKVKTISSSTDLIEGSKRANIMLPNGTIFVIDNALFSIKSRRNLLIFKDIRLNGYYIETANDNDIKYLYIVSNVSTGKQILEKLLVLFSGLYYTSISTIEVNGIMNQKFNEPNNFII